MIWNKKLHLFVASILAIILTEFAAVVLPCAWWQAHLILGEIIVMIQCLAMIGIVLVFLLALEEHHRIEVAKLDALAKLMIELRNR